MPSGNTIAFKLLLLTALFACLTTNSQTKDTSRFNSDFPSFKIDEECLSKSERTSKPTIIKLTREQLSTITKVKELISIIPDSCEVLCVFISIKKPDDKVFEFRNIGNEMVYANRLIEGKFILVENLVTTCTASHKANYKIIIE
jgi:hypothetical protein